MFLVPTLSLTRCRLFKYCITHATAVWEAMASSVQLKGKNHGYKQASSCPLGIIFPSRHRSCWTRRGEKCPFFWFSWHARSTADSYTVVDLRAMCRSWLLDGCADRLLPARIIPAAHPPPDSDLSGIAETWHLCGNLSNFLFNFFERDCPPLWLDL
jgi:hypothetical protein